MDGLVVAITVVISTNILHRVSIVKDIEQCQLQFLLFFSLFKMFCYCVKTVTWIGHYYVVVNPCVPVCFLMLNCASL